MLSCIARVFVMVVCWCWHGCQAVFRSLGTTLVNEAYSRTVHSMDPTQQATHLHTHTRHGIQTTVITPAAAAP